MFKLSRFQIVSLSYLCICCYLLITAYTTHPTITINVQPVKEKIVQMKTITPEKKVQNTQKKNEVKTPKKKHVVKPNISRGTDRSYKYYAVVTAYCSCSYCNGNSSGLSASGKHLTVGMVAASRRFPFGTRIKILGKIYVVEDRLAERYDNRIDLFFSSHSESLDWGKKVLKVEVFY